MDKTVKKCLEKKCSSEATRRGYCERHYRYHVYHGDIATTPRKNKEGGVSKHPLYRCWASMKNRCYNKSDKRNYQWYGGRGIKVCDRWRGENGFKYFVEDMGPRPDGYSLDRIDPGGDYCPENCRWASAKQQSYNRRKSLKFYIDGKQYNTEEAASLLKKNPETLRKRVRLGLNDSEVISPMNIIRNRVGVYCIDTREHFNSIMEAGHAKNIAYQSILACVHGKQRTAAGLHWCTSQNWEKVKKELGEML